MNYRANALDYFHFDVDDDYYYQWRENSQDRAAFKSWLRPHRSRDYLNTHHNGIAICAGISRLTKIVDEFHFNTL